MELRSTLQCFATLLVSCLIDRSSFAGSCGSRPSSQILTHQIERIDSFLGSRRAVATDILQIISNYSAGVFASAVVEVQTVRGREVLKIFSDSIVEVKASLAIQELLAIHGFAPHIKGFLGSSEVRKLLERYPDLQTSDSTPGPAILMEKVTFAIELSGANSNLYPILADKSAIERQLLNLEQLMEKYRIVPAVDLQAGLTLDGRLVLYDFDTYFHISSNQRVYGVGKPDMKISDFWNDIYNDHLYRARFGPIDRFWLNPFRVRLSGLRTQLNLNP